MSGTDGADVLLTRLTSLEVALAERGVLIAELVAENVALGERGPAPPVGSGFAQFQQAPVYGLGG